MHAIARKAVLRRMVAVCRLLRDALPESHLFL